MKPSNHPDIGAGLLFIGIGIFALWGGQELRAGSASAMGPGYFPTALAMLLIGLGVLTLVRAWRGPKVRLPSPAWRTVASILFAIIGFALLLEPLGLVLATMGMVIGCRWAAGSSRWKEVALLSSVLAVSAVGIFVYGLDVLLPLWPSWPVNWNLRT